MTGTDFEPRLGADIFGAALTGDRDRLDALLRELTAYSSDPDTYARFASAWIDALPTMMGIDVKDADVQLVSAETGEVTAVAQVDDDVPADIRWAVLVFTSRLARDEQTWATAFSRDLPADAEQVRRHLFRLLDTLANTLRAHISQQRQEARTAGTVGQPVSPTWPARAPSLRDGAPLN